MDGQKEEYKAGGDRHSGFSLRFCGEGIQSEDCRDRNSIWSEDFIEVTTSDWLLCISDLSAFTQYLIPDFYYQGQLEIMLQLSTNEMSFLLKEDSLEKCEKGFIL